MNIKNILTKTVAVSMAVMLLSSCNDFLTITPPDKTIGKDFWKKKSHVEEMVTGAYKGAIDYGIQERAVIWGAFRSDELVKNSSYSNNSLDNINAVILTPNNGYNSWSSFYSVINDCNIVLKHAPGVMDVDPEFTEGDYMAARAQMLALRSLCYLYLVKTFRDVPYITEAYETDNQETQVAQSTPGFIIDKCIEDLKEAEGNCLVSGGYGNGDWRNVGYITQDAVRAILADCYLWKAAMTHNASDYQEAIRYIDLVITTKDEYYRRNHSDNVTGSTTKDIYHLLSGATALYQIFDVGNSRESILEFQYDGTNNSNQALQNCYYKTDKDHAYGRLQASKLFSMTNTTEKNKEFTNIEGAEYMFDTPCDWRFWNVSANIDLTSEATPKSVRKMVNTSAVVDPSTASKGLAQTGVGEYEHFKMNWIVYRLTDLMLMKAEAMVQLASGDEDETNLKGAFDLVKVVNDRSMSDDAKNDTLKFTNYSTKNKMELLVLAERGRELCFEGKRWYDLIRYSYEHMTGVEPYKLMSEIEEYPALDQNMLKMIIRKYDSGGDAFTYKMKGEPYLYWPILESELKVNGLLKQNPVYKEDKSTSKK